MQIDVVDIVIITGIFMVVGYYAFLRYKEEKRKEEALLIPTLESYKEKFLKEKEDYILRAKSYEDKLEDIKIQLQDLKSKIALYPWTESQIEYFKKMKGSEFEYFLNTTFQMLGFEIIDPEYFKEFHIDTILKFEDEDRIDYIIVDYVDFTEVKKIDENYLKDLEKGKEKYSISKVWIITNGKLDESVVKKIYDYDFNLLDTENIVKLLPSLNFFYEYEDLKAKFHATQILHKEMFDEVIRREHWLEEVDKKLFEAIEKRNKLS
ncbi:MAG: restriction endonuclease [Hydrogenothermaceae bacterium]|nr:restriction endonuclease [Hydrogenothermaceae bacterium]